MQKKAPDSKSCANCGDGGLLSACARCHLAEYCGKACQRQHWPDHKPHCVKPEDRTLKECKAACVSNDPCSVCHEDMALNEALNIMLPCSHKLHAKCLEQLRSTDSKFCPLCRATIPPPLGELQVIVGVYEETRRGAKGVDRESDAYLPIIGRIRGLAEHGHASSMVEYSNWLRTCRPSPERVVESMVWLNRAVAMKNARAFFVLGALHKDGIVLEQSNDKAIFYFRKAADLGDPNANYFVSHSYFHGLYGIEIDYVESHKLCIKAAEAGVPEACGAMGDKLLHGFGCEIDDEAAIRWLLKGAEAGDMYSSHVLGGIYCRGEIVAECPSESFKYYLAASELGCVKSKHNVGMFYLEGYGVTKDYDEAMKWLIASGDIRSYQIVFDIGMMLLEGCRVTRDVDKAVTIFRRCIELNVRDAFYMLGCMLFDGDEIPMDNAEAARLFRIAAEDMECGKCCHALGRCYLYGFGVQVDEKEARKWFDNAEECGYRPECAYAQTFF